MKTLSRYLLSKLIPVFWGAEIFFILILEMIDIFANLWLYMSNAVPLSSILMVALYYIPKCFSYALPLSLLFAASYSMGDLYAKNELTAVFSAGIPLIRFAMPMLVCALVFSVFSFYFDDRIVIITLKEKNTLQTQLTNKQESLNNRNVAIISRDGNMVYKADNYDDKRKRISGISIIERDDDGRFISLTTSSAASWQDGAWAFENVGQYTFSGDDLVYSDTAVDTSRFTEKPEVFQKNIVNIEEMNTKDASMAIDDLRRSGQPYGEQLTDYYKRYSFSLTSFIVVFLSLSFGGRFKKNVMLLSLLLSLATAVLFYISQMLMQLLAKWEYIPPFAGAWIPIAVFISISVILLRYART